MAEALSGGGGIRNTNLSKTPGLTSGPASVSSPGKGAGSPALPGCARKRTKKPLERRGSGPAGEEGPLAVLPPALGGSLPSPPPAGGPPLRDRGLAGAPRVPGQEGAPGGEARAAPRGEMVAARTGRAREAGRGAALLVEPGDRERGRVDWGAVSAPGWCVRRGWAGRAASLVPIGAAPPLHLAGVPAAPDFRPVTLPLGPIPAVTLRGRARRGPASRGAGARAGGGTQAAAPRIRDG